MVEITREKIDIERVLAAVDDDETGGLVFFVGRVRNRSNGRNVSQMIYEGYDEMAKSELIKIAAQATEKWTVKKIALVHRLGRLSLGDASVVIAVACEHRAQAFDACRFAIDRLKKRLPIWKKEYGEDGQWWVEGVKPESQEPINSIEEDSTS